MLPSIAQIARAAEGRLVMEDWHNFGPDYDLTLLAWKANVDARWAELADRYDERFKRMWDWYLLSSAGSFRARALQLWQVVLSRDGIAAGTTPPASADPRPTLHRAVTEPIHACHLAHGRWCA